MQRPTRGVFPAASAGEPWTANDEDQYVALFDPVTGLPRRVLIRDRVDAALARARRAQRFVAVFHVFVEEDDPSTDTSITAADIDRLCAERICSGVRSDDSVGRVGEHEFVVVCHDIVDKDHSMMILRRFVDAFDTPLAIGGQEHTVEPSVGVALAYGTESAPTLLARARRAARESFR